MILLTGATGFVGRHLCRALARAGHQVTSLVRSIPQADDELARHSTLVTGELRDPFSLAAALAKVDLVIHAAGVVSSRPDLLTDVNVIGTRHLVDACRRLGVRRFIFFSSAAVLMPPSPYGQSKRSAETIVEQGGLDATILRPAQIYGEGDRKGMGKLIRLIQRSPVVPLPGNGAATLQPVSVHDVTGVLLAMLRDPRSHGKSYTLAGPTPVSYRELIDLIQRLLGTRRIVCPIPVAWLAACARWQERLFRDPAFSMDQLDRLLCSTRLHSDEATLDFGFEPRSLETGLRALLSVEGVGAAPTSVFKPGTSTEAS